MQPSESDLARITALLSSWRAGDAEAHQQVFQLLYPVLRAIAQRKLHAHGAGRLSLRATELLHESYARLVQQQTPWQNRGHFLAVAARVIRRVLVDLVRQRLADKRGGSGERTSLEQVAELPEADGPAPVDLLALDEALVLLERRDPRAAQTVELKYFSGMSNEEVADHLGIGVATVVRQWQFGRAFLFRHLAA